MSGEMDDALIKQAPRIKAVTAKQEPLALTFEDIDCAFDEHFNRPSLTIIQRLQLLGVTLFMLCLPVVYVGFLGLVVFFTFFSAYSIGIQQGNIGPAALFTALGITSIGFLIRPLWLRKTSREEAELHLDVDAELILAHLIHRLCDHIGVRHPVSINLSMTPEVDVSVNSHQLLKFDLSIGLPLITCLSARQFTAVLARELSRVHYTTSLYGHLVTQSVMRWLNNSIHNKDGWLEWFDDLQEKSRIPMAGFFNQVGRAGIQGTNQLLSLFLNVAQRISLSTLRALELYADQYQANIAGSQAFADTLVNLKRIEMALAVSREQNFSHNLKRCVENFPRLVQANFTSMSEEEKEKARAEVLRLKVNSKTILPSQEERIHLVKGLTAKSSFTLKRPALAFLVDVDGVSKDVTLRFYKQYNRAINIKKLVPVAGKIEQIHRDYIQSTELSNYTLGWFMPNFVWDVPGVKKIDQLSEKKKIDLIEQSIVALRRHIPELNNCRAEHHCLVKDLIRLESEKIISKLQEQPYKKSAKETSMDVAHEKCKESIATYDTYFGYRIAVAVSLLENETIKQKTLQLLNHLKKLKEVEMSVTEGQIKKSVLQNVMALKDMEHKSSYHAKVRSLAQALAISSDDLRFHMKEIPVSLLNDSSYAEVIKKSTVQLMGPIDNIQGAALEVVEDFDQLLDCFTAFNQAISLRLVKISTHIEKKYHIKPVRLLKQVKSQDIHAA